MNIVLLAAGDDSVFETAGYTFPKNLIEVNGVPLIQRVIEQLKSITHVKNHLIVCLKKNEVRKFYTDSVVKLLVPDATIVEIDGPTAGAACTALLAIDHINDDEELLIVNGDQIIDEDLADITNGFKQSGADAATIVFRAVHPRWSFVRFEQSVVVEAAEKCPISSWATAGVYWFTHGKDFIDAAGDMLRKNKDVNGQFYVCPVFNELVLKQMVIRGTVIPSSRYISLANPKNIETYEVILRAKE